MDKHPENEILKVGLDRLRRLGVEVEVIETDPMDRDTGIDAHVKIGRGRPARTYAVHVKKGLRPAMLGAIFHQLERTKHPPLLVADYVTPPIAEKLRAQNVAFLDTAGNVFVDQRSLFIWVKGEKRDEPYKENEITGRAFQATGLKVLFALVCNPDWINRPYREIAKLAGVAHGTVGWVVTDLQKSGFAMQLAGRRRLIQQETLLEKWAEGYARTLRPKLMLGRFRAEDEKWWRELQPAKYDLLFGGEPAAESVTRALKSETVTLYGEKIDTRLLVDCKLRKDPYGQIEILQRFWNFPTDDDQVVPLPLIYADLLYIGDARCLEIAKIIYDKIANGLIERN